MTKSELVTSVSALADMPCEAAQKAVSAVFTAIIEALGKGDEVSIQGFGTFVTRRREEHKAKNPGTGEEITVPAYTAAVFKPGKRMRDAVKDN